MMENILFERVCESVRERGYCLNTVRKAIIRTLCQQRRTQEISAVDLWLQIHSVQKVSISAVYNNLGILSQLGVVEKRRSYQEPSMFRIKNVF